MELTESLLKNYLPYAKMSIISRAIESIDGLKPVQRRVLYSMEGLGLRGKDKRNSKCTKIVGECMGKYHPHGDSSIYEALVNMSVDYDGINLPYIASHGSFGKVYSEDGPAAPRYTEAKLADICDELFEGIKEDAVDFVDTFDSTNKEPVLLPVKFPTILVNSVPGIAVGTSSYIPSFALNNVCDATIGVIKGDIKTPAELAAVLGVPEFTTGGYLHTDEATLVKLCETGKAGFALSGTAICYPNSIVITELPYNTTTEKIISAITDYAKSGELREIADVNNNIGSEGFQIKIALKRGANSREVLKKIARLTPLRTRISFRTRVIINNRCCELGLLELLNEWLKFRDNTVKRIHTYRLNKDIEKEHELATWEKIKGHILEVVDIISKNTEENSKPILMNKFLLDEEQCEYLFEFKIRQITEDRVRKSLEKLAQVRDSIKYNKLISTSADERTKIIIKELLEIKEKYGNKPKTQRTELVVEETGKIEKPPVSDEQVQVVITKNGYIKRLTTFREMSNFSVPDGDSVLYKWNIKNNEHIAVFTYDGTVYKILVDSIDASKGFKETLAGKLNLVSTSEIMYIDMCKDYSGYFNIIYPNGRGRRVSYANFSGNRSKYISLYEPCKPYNVFITKENKFFIVTKRLKASYIDLTNLGMFSSRAAFKVARVGDDAIIGIHSYDKVPIKEMIDLDRYMKDYTVKIGNDYLFKKPDDVTTGTLNINADMYARSIIKGQIESIVGQIDEFGNPESTKTKENSGDVSSSDEVGNNENSTNTSNSVIGNDEIDVNDI